MKRQQFDPELAAEIADMICNQPGGSFDFLQRVEQAHGGTVVPLGAEKPFAVPSRDWAATLIVVRGMEARMVILLARHPRTGAFKRLVASIRRSGLVPVVVTPIGLEMPAVLAHLGWRETIETQDGERLSTWRP